MREPLFARQSKDSVTSGHAEALGSIETQVIAVVPKALQDSAEISLLRLREPCYMSIYMKTYIIIITLALRYGNERDEHKGMCEFIHIQAGMLPSSWLKTRRRTGAMAHC